MKDFKGLKLTKSYTKYYKKGEHKTLTGLCIHLDYQWIENDEIKTRHVILTSRDLFINGLKKLDYLENNSK